MIIYIFFFFFFFFLQISGRKTVIWLGSIKINEPAKPPITLGYSEICRISFETTSPSRPFLTTGAAEPCKLEREILLQNFGRNPRPWNGHQIDLQEIVRGRHIGQTYLSLKIKYQIRKYFSSIYYCGSMQKRRVGAKYSDYICRCIT